jgi:uncharacterized protein YkwD
MLFALALAAAALPGDALLERALRDAARATCRKEVVVDRDLTRAAREFVRAARANASPLTGSALSFYAGLESAEPASVGSVAITSPPSKADRAVGDLLPKECRFDRAGIAAVELPGGRAAVALVTASHATDLAPLPGRVEPGADLQVAGTLNEGLSEPRLFISGPLGIEEHPMHDQGRRFSATVHLAAKGAYTVEVLATGSGGPQVVALRRIFAGVQPPVAPPPEPPRRHSGLSGVQAAVEDLRASRGLPLLERDGALDAVAESHSREMARTRTFAHVLPSDGNVSDRLDRAGYARRAAGENIGLSATALDAHDAVASSPAHLANLLDPRYTRIGLGAAQGESPEGGDAVYLTEVLATPILGSADPAGEVSRVLVSRRTRLGLPPLQRDPDLDAVARRSIGEMARSGGALARADQDRAVRAALETTALRSAVAEAFVGSTPEESDFSRNLGERSWTRYGVGAVYASSETYGPGRLWVLILFAR